MVQVKHRHAAFVLVLGLTACDGDADESCEDTACETVESTDSANSGTADSTVATTDGTTGVVDETTAQTGSGEPPDSSTTTGEDVDSDESGGACGDGVVDDGEACDDGGESAVCNADCTLSACGDGLTNPSAGEACDDGGESESCNENCTLAECGDSLVNASAGEVCDDGATEDDDGCSADCLSDETCGNRFLDRSQGETCDDGNDDSEDGCEACQAQPMQVCASSLPVTLPDESSMQLSLELSFPYVVTDVDVELSVSHGRLHDLAIGLSHNETEVVLADELATEASAQELCTGEDMAAVLDDDATGSIQRACDDAEDPAIDGRFQPIEALSAFADADAAGAWTLTVADGVAENEGELDSWCLNLNGFGVVPRRVYWATTGGSVWSVEDDGGNPTEIASGGSATFVVATNPNTGHVYYDRTSTIVTRIDADGSNAVDVVTTGSGVFGLAVDADAGYLFRADFNANRVVRTGLDGSNALTVATATSPSGVALDPSAQRVYFITYNSTQLYRVNYDGTGQEIIVPSIGGQGVGVAVDSGAERVYYSRRANEIFVANLDGTNPSTLITNQTAVQGLAIDTEVGRIFWAAPSAALIRSANLSDGSNITDVTSCEGGCWGLAR